MRDRKGERERERERERVDFTRMPLWVKIKYYEHIYTVENSLLAGNIHK